MFRPSLALLPILLWSGAAAAQRTGENAVTAADDAFGTSVGAEQIGLYDAGNVRGFSPVSAGNIRVEGLSVTEHGGFTQRILSGSAIRVGLTAQGYPFPAPTGIADYSLRAPGDQATISPVVTIGPGRSRLIDVDSQLPLAGAKLGLAAGLTLRHEETISGGGFDTIAAGGVLRWRPSAAVEAKAFYARMEYFNLRPAPLTFTSGPFLPPAGQDRYFNPEWAEGRETRQMGGALVRARLSESLAFTGGIFRWDAEQKRGVQTFFTGVGPDGQGQRTLVATAGQHAASTSGEARLSWSIEEGPRRHTFIAGVRGRSTERLYGGADVVNLGPGRIDEPIDTAPQELEFGARARDRVRQTTFGIGYSGRWQDIGELSLNLQKTDYRKTTEREPGDEPIVARQRPWLFSAAASLNLTPRLSVYAGYVRGLEEGGVAPQDALNRNAPAPAIRTRQLDGGLRYRLADRLTLVAGLFDVEKPYINVGPDRFYRELGVERHRGAEISLAGQLTTGLTLVAGAVLMDAEVSGEAVEAGLIGPRPVGSIGRTLRLNADWRPNGTSPLSFNVGINSIGRRIASARSYAELSGSQLTVPGRTAFDLGARYRFQLAEAPATLRLQATNIFNAGTWDVNSSGAFYLVQPRRLLTTLAVDF